MEILKALRITTSLPILYSPYKFEKKLFIDGGIMNNFPIDLFEKNSKNILGIYISCKNKNYSEINNLEDIFFSIIDCINQADKTKYIKGYEKEIIILNIESINLHDIDISKENLNKIINIGYNSIINYFKN